MKDKRGLRAPEGYNAVQRVSWYAGIAAGMTLLGGAVVVLALALARWLPIG